jgi:molecular chaperone GrpE
MPKQETIKKEKLKTKNIEEDLKRQVNEKEKIIENYLNDLKRLQADFENYIKRTNKEKEDLIKLATKELVLKLINVLDDFERALDSIKDTENKEDILKGIEMIFKQFHKILEEEGIKQIDSIGKKFDPYIHEAVKHLNSDKEENTIIKEIQKGYFLHNHVLRPSKVIISKGGKKNE